MNSLSIIYLHNKFKTIIYVRVCDYKCKMKDIEEIIALLVEKIGSDMFQRGGIGSSIDEFLRNYQLSLNHLISSASPIDILPNRTIPLNETSLVLAHNAYNSVRTGSIMPNQGLSLTELLDVGVRAVELDVYWDHGEARLCHEICNQIPLAYNRLLSDALTEVNTWLINNPSEVIVIKFEDYLHRHFGNRGAAGTHLESIVKSTLNTTSVFTPSDFSTFGGWPSIDDMSNNGKQIILMPQDARNPLMFEGRWGGMFKNRYSTSTISRIRPLNYTIPPSSPGQLLEVGEDRTLLGLAGDFIGHKDVAGIMTKEEIELLRNNGVNIISLDKIEKRDSRFTDELTVGNALNSYYIMIPTTLIAAAFTPRITQESSKGDIAQKMLIQLLVGATLPDECRVLYHAAKQGMSTYREIKDQNKAAEESDIENQAHIDNISSLGRVVASGTLAGIETVARIGIQRMLMQSQSIDLYDPQMYAQSYLSYMITEMVINGVKGTVIGAHQGYQGLNLNSAYNCTTSLASGAFNGVYEVGKQLVYDVPKSIISSVYGAVGKFSNMVMRQRNAEPTNHLKSL